MKRAAIYVDSPTGTQTHVLNVEKHNRALCGAFAKGWQTTTIIERMCHRCRKIQKRKMLERVFP
jgi:hypothetical protein